MFIPSSLERIIGVLELLRVQNMIQSYHNKVQILREILITRTPSAHLTLVSSFVPYSVKNDLFSSPIDQAKYATLSMA